MLTGKNRACSEVLHISKNTGQKWYWASLKLTLFLEELEETNANITFLLSAGNVRVKGTSFRMRENKPRQEGNPQACLGLCSFPSRHGLEGKILHLGRTTLPPSLHSLSAGSVPAFMFLLHTFLYTGTLPSSLFPSIFILPLFTLGYIRLQKKSQWRKSQRFDHSVTMHL